MKSSTVAVIYVRYSSHAQRDVSIDQQIRECKKYAESLGLTVIEIYADHAMTGRNDNRPEFQRMIRDSASGAFAFVIVYTLDRFARDRYDSAVHKKTLKDNGVKVLSAMEQISDDPTGVLMESLLEGLAEYYSKELARKIIRGQEDNARKCMVVSGSIPFGYRRSADGYYEIHPDEAPIVREIFNRVAAGDALIEICNSLNARGILTKHKAKWNKSSFNTMLSNERYIGVYIYKDSRTEDGMPAIVSREVFERVQQRIHSKPNARKSDRPEKRRREHGMYLLTGKLYCGECESPMVGVSGTGKHGEPHFYYTCKTHRENKNSCRMKPITRDFAEKAVAEVLKSLFTRDDVVEWMADSVIRYLAENHESDEIRMLRDRLTSTTKQKDNVLKAILAGIITDSTKDMLTNLEHEESMLKAKIALAQDRMKTDITRDDIVAFLHLFRQGDVETKQFQEQLIDTFLVRAYVYADRWRVVINYTGHGTEEIDVPFAIDEAEEKSSGRFDLPEDVNGVRIDAPELHFCNLIRTQTVYFVCGLFVAIAIPNPTRKG